MKIYKEIPCAAELEIIQLRVQNEALRETNNLLKNQYKVFTDNMFQKDADERYNKALKKLNVINLRNINFGDCVTLDNVKEALKIAAYGKD